MDSGRGTAAVCAAIEVRTAGWRGLVWFRRSQSRPFDASLLLIPLVVFLPAGDPRILGTLRAIEEKLLVNDEFVLRYEPDNSSDGLPPGEGAFLACSFWLVDNYILQGRYDDAQRLF